MTSGGGAALPEISLTEAAPPDWEELLAACAAADYSHTEHWQTCARDHHPGAGSWWLCARDGGRLLGGLVAVVAPPRRLARLVPMQRADSSHEGTSGGPLVRDDLPEPVREAVFLALTDALLAHRAGGLASVTMALNPDTEARYGRLLGDRTAWQRHDSPTAMLPLDGGEDHVAAECWTNNKRNERNRGLKRGAEVFATRDPDLLAAYHPIYAEACRVWGRPPTPLGQLQALLADPRDRVFFTCVRLEGQVIGGHLCLHLGDRVFAWNGVSDPAYARTHFPGTLCFWGDVVEACRRGAAWLDIGASGGSGSLESFKKNFGAAFRERGYYVADTAALKLVRRLRAAAGGSGGGARLHDGAAGGRGA